MASVTVPRAVPGPADPVKRRNEPAPTEPVERRRIDVSTGVSIDSRNRRGGMGN